MFFGGIAQEHDMSSPFWKQKPTADSLFGRSTVVSHELLAEGLMMTNNSVIDRFEGKGGALIAGGDGWSLHFHGGVWAENYAEFGGAVHTLEDSVTSVTFEETNFENNRAGDVAGAWRAWGTSSYVCIRARWSRSAVSALSETS